MEEIKDYTLEFDDDLPAYTVRFTHKGTHYLAHLGFTYYMPSKPTLQAFNDEKWVDDFANSAVAEIAIMRAGEDGLPLDEDFLYEAKCSDVCEEEIRAHVDKFIQKLIAEKA